jgi:hypothetical protein
VPSGIELLHSNQNPTELVSLRWHAYNGLSPNEVDVVHGWTGQITSHCMGTQSIAAKCMHLRCASCLYSYVNFRPPRLRCISININVPWCVNEGNIKPTISSDKDTFKLILGLNCQSYQLTCRCCKNWPRKPTSGVRWLGQHFYCTSRCLYHVIIVGRAQLATLQCRGCRACMSINGNTVTNQLLNKQNDINDCCMAGRNKVRIIIRSATCNDWWKSRISVKIN